MTMTTLMNSGNRLVLKCTNESDGTGETDVVKVDKLAYLATDGAVPARIDVDGWQGAVSGFNYVRAEWQNASDKMIAILAPGSHDYCFEQLRNTDSVDQDVLSGDIIVSTDGAFDGSSYDITLYCTLVPGGNAALTYEFTTEFVEEFVA